MNIQNILETLINFRDDRDWEKFHTDSALSQSLMIEAAELNRLFQWGKWAERQELADEVADCMIYCLYLCINNGFDPVQIIEDKIVKNEQKYPVEINHGEKEGWK